MAAFHPTDTYLNQPTRQADRRQVLKQVACGFGSLAAMALANRATVDAQENHSSSLAHFAPRAKRIIFVFMQGGPSQIDTFDPKPMLDKRDGEEVEFYELRTRQVSRQRVFRSPWKFKQYGQSGRWVSELFPHLATCVDRFCLLRGMHTEGVAHGPATLFLHTGATNLVRPAVGSWVTYGLGTENESLPGFVTIQPPPTKGGPRNYSNAFLPARFQGTAIGRAGQKVEQARIKFIQNLQLTRAEQQEQFDLLQGLNKLQRERLPDNDDFEALVKSYELAFRMQSEAPPAFDLAQESEYTRRMYGIDQSATHEFGVQCLMARRLAEAGVRYIQINYADLGATPRWDQHSNLQQHEKHALATDQPVAGLLKDLDQRGLLEDTLVWWGGEFGRTPFAQNRDGRDHNPKGFSVFLAGGGVKPGFAHGETDEFGYEAVAGRVHMHDLHATLLHLLGLDHKRLTWRLGGRDFRLTDVHGHVVDEIIS